MPHETEDTSDTATRRAWQILARPRPDRTASAERRAAHWREVAQACRALAGDARARGEADTAVQFDIRAQAADAVADLIDVQLRGQ